MARQKDRTAVRPKKRFHHGDLREALIAATRELLIEHGRMASHWPTPAAAPA